MTSTWGPDTWRAINAIARSAPEHPTPTEVVQYKNFFMSIGYVLPCPKCRRHYLSWLAQFNMSRVCSSRDAMIRWVIDLHNAVNRRLGKRVLAYPEALQVIMGPISGGAVASPPAAASESTDAASVTETIGVVAGLSIMLGYVASRLR